MAKQLVVRLRADGTVDAETIGMHGPECLDHIEALEALLDAETVSSRFTEDYTSASVDGVTRLEAEQTDGAP
ncbi:DUF2997 domain-containing protein [Microbacterium sp. QXD-8]|jgi:hypothetical protein|uniref:DUF2997 domain-containing protein n=1 Tax=Microbacterium psychrotolerans TaxID=3068321 RepID=A0ABU0YZ79_9MICO|nr:DUF2997 domain-containing protein [Microbacterium sp. QXD-8]MDQ7876836.1 DUF2997 domain-containing protein [Microbacterium sp. QXD-8]